MKKKEECLDFMLKETIKENVLRTTHYKEKRFSLPTS